MATGKFTPILVQAGTQPPLPIWMCHICGATFRCELPPGRHDTDGDYQAPTVTCPHCRKVQTIAVSHPSGSYKTITYGIYTSS